MGNIYNSFSSWLTGKGLGGYLDSQGQLANGTSQAFFSREYTAWVKHVIKAYTADIIDHFGLPSNTKLTLVSINQNNPSGLPIIRGLTPAQVDYFFNGTSDFTWQTCGRKPVTHTRYYSNEFNVGGTGDTTPPAAPIVALANDTGSSGADLITSDGTLVVTPAEAGGTIQYSTDG
ncbi:MAG: hypothetical protein KDK26_19790, partial [Roseivivax sp.]|nr:hypothetical protein [Roseivivax sp.]